MRAAARQVGKNVIETLSIGRLSKFYQVVSVVHFVIKLKFKLLVLNDNNGVESAPDFRAAASACSSSSS